MRKFIYLLMLSIVIFPCCEKEDISIENLDGSWVETSLRKDTIVFNSPDFEWGDNWFELRRDVMLSTGPYEFRISGDSISIHWMLSSSTFWQSYYFRLDKDEFVIGKFYHSEELNKDKLRFEKLKKD